MRPSSLRASPCSWILALCAVGCTRDPADERPNFFVIDVDNLRADRLEPTDERRAIAPNMHALADRGTAFTQGFTNAGWTHPAVASFLTGRYHPLSASSTELPMDPNLGRRLPEILNAYGYSTIAFWGRTAPAQVPLIQKGFSVNKVEDSNSGFGGGQVQTWLSNLPQEPFFAYVHEIDLHMNHDEPNPSAEAVRSGYDALLTRYDRQIGEYIATLDSAKFSHETVILLFSDHGEDMFDHLGYGHCLLYDVVTHVPMVVVDPRFPTGARRDISTLVETIDLAPTILARAGIPLDVTMAGQSLLPLLDGSGTGFTERDVFSLTDSLNVAIRTPRYKLLTRVPNAQYSRQGIPIAPPGQMLEPVPELYDIVADPGETRDLAGTLPVVRDELMTRLMRWRDERRTTGAPQPPAAVREAIQKQGYWSLVDPGSAPPGPASAPAPTPPPARPPVTGPAPR